MAMIGELLNTARKLVSSLLKMLSWLLPKASLQSSRKPAIACDGTDGLILGIALTPCYGTVSLRRADGTLEAISKADGDHDYLKMMQRLSLEGSKHPTPPYGELGDGVSDAPRQAWRRLRKRIGLAASSDAARLCSVMAPLKQEVESREGRFVREVKVAMPSIIALYEEDIRDALEYVGLPFHPEQFSYTCPRELRAAFVGHGCKDEGLIPSTNALVIEYTKHSLSAEFNKPRVSPSRLPGNVRTDFGTGSLQSAMPSHWQRVSTNIKSTVRAYNSGMLNTVDVVLLIGESADDPDFRKHIKLAIEEFGNAKVISADPIFVASKGAAELAWFDPQA